ncbi:replicative DNA helicase [Thermomonospora echinospora]|uniref:Replicative DNA helicase n=1 Tax=Thermomonospora echinospora TaxID=1992 RepID=A0A1H6DCF1_9ACTN|nr:replicative DNA helicase [Thermomonospora echinospora]
MTDLGSHEREFERTPPHDVAAEQSVIGGMLISPTAIAEVVEILRSSDFYRPAHQILFDTILDLYGRGEPADAVTIVAELTKRGEINRVGGAPYLHTLMATVPTAANAGYYAKIVRERAVLRRLVEVGTRIVQLGYSSDGADADEVLDRAQAEVFAIAEKRTGEDYLPLSEIMPGALDEIEAIGSRGGQMTGVPTGFSDLDALTNGLHPGQMIIVAARPAIGKALNVDTPLPTPDGWTTMGEVKVGDHLLGADGKPTRVVAATEVMTDRPCYEVEFSDGEVIIADAQHQWRTSVARRPAGRRTLGSRGKASLFGGSISHPSRSAYDRRGSRIHAAVSRTRMPETAGTGFLPGAAGPGILRSRSGLVLPPAPHPRDGHRSVTGDPRGSAAVRMARWDEGSVGLLGTSVRTTEEIARTLLGDDGRPHHAVPVAAPFELPHVRLPVDPYRLGVRLGSEAGGRGVSTGSGDENPEDVAGIRCSGPDRRGLPDLTTGADGLDGGWDASVGEPGGVACGQGGPAGGADGYGARGDGRIPVRYLRASESQRRALLAGLLDAGGTCADDGRVRFTTRSRRLAEDVRDLVISLGHQATVETGPAETVPGSASPRHVVCCTPADTVFRLPRKAVRQKRAVHPEAWVRHIVDVRPIPSVPVRCVQVDNADHMYLAGRSCIPTHNSTLALDFARAASIKHGLTSAFFSLEMGRNEITMRLLSAEARVALHAMRSGTMQDEDWTRLARRMSEVAEAPLFIDDSPNMSMMEIRAKCRRLKQQHDLRLVIIDYLQLMTSNKRVESRQVEVSEFSRSLKLLAKELQVPVIALSQLNRGPEQRTDKKPMVSDLRESGSIEQDADMVILLHREDAYEKESPRAGEADLIVAKHRNGPTATVTVAFQGHYSRFVDMAQ